MNGAIYPQQAPGVFLSPYAAVNTTAGAESVFDLFLEPLGAVNTQPQRTDGSHR